MEPRLNIPQIAHAIKAHGYTQAALAERIGVQPAAVTQWLKGETQPLPQRLLKLSLLLELSFDDLFIRTEPLQPAPVVAYRKRAGNTTTENEMEHAREKGRLLRPLATYLPNQLLKPAEFRDPSLEYSYVEHAVRDLRKTLGIQEDDAVGYQHLIGTFSELGAVIIPVMWGKKDAHGNALHILLPESGATWIYLNLDSNACDFNFWMAHELAHVFTPKLAGSDAGEDFAEEFAGALLFPESASEKLYDGIIGKSAPVIINTIKRVAKERTISFYTVVKRLNRYAENRGLKDFTQHKSAFFGASKNFEKSFPLISEALFPDGKPDAADYISENESVFKTPIYNIMRQYLTDSAHGAGWLAEVMDISLIDAKALYQALIN
ncbi:helix-turn-helix domain-containing protein [Collimonas antrihumi]|uniref:helix-turn-helix domain-containing protein n=1 Tax=Collimonas antrihumi TaxID=1940615 RepID=UPI001B8C6BC1|nr:helix-turn-helix transcriptional regulator [Collimonas antrihumi]